MRSAPPDTTARARIRDAAVVRFATDGFDAPLRAIATDAGVSAALVLHHFGSKDGLRDACDEHVFTQVRDAKGPVLRDRTPLTMLEALASVDAYAPLFAYLVRSLQTGGPRASAFVDHLVDDAVEYLADGVAAGTLRPSRDEHARARYLVLTALGAVLLDVAISGPATPRELMAAYLDRMALPALELFTDGLLTTRDMLDGYLLHAPDPPRPASSDT
ncbi:TetR family transcriptional regulator [Sediminihabitans luteus]|nr:TetR family transcriptional regulator [Sediminihabitans luteus]GII97815.1 TetR family transcriptional regulator [Sediminihabitans luteus]